MAQLICSSEYSLSPIFAALLNFSLARIVPLADYTSSNLQIKTLNPKLPFRAVGYSDKAEVSGWGMPSNKSINLSVGASGSVYAAPANGYFAFSTTNTASAVNYTYLRNETTNMCFYAMANAGIVADGFIPAKKGDLVSLGYVSSIINTFKFIYAEGSK